MAGLFVLIYSTILVYTELKTPIYRAVGVVKFEPPGSGIVGTKLRMWDQWTAINTQVQILQSNDTAERLGRKMGLQTPVGISAEHIKNSHLISISASGPDAVEVADIVIAAIELYIDMDVEARSRSIVATLHDITARRDNLKVALLELEEKRRAYLESHPSAGSESSLLTILVDLETRRDVLLDKFTPGHPDMVSLAKRIKSTRARLARLPAANLELERMTRGIGVNKDLFITLSRQLEGKRVALSGVPTFVTVVSRVTVPSAPIYPNKRENRILGFFGALFLALIAGLMRDSLDISISTIEDIEETVGVKVLGMIPHLESDSSWIGGVRDFFRKRRSSIPVFRSRLLFNQSHRSQVIEGYHAIRTAIRSQNPEIENLTLAFTSTGGAEGKTLTSINFCLAAAQDGLKTLLIGADVRRADLHRILGLPKQDGLVEVLAGRTDWRDVIQEAEDIFMGDMDIENVLAFPGIENFKVMTSCTSPALNIISLYSSPRFNALVADLRGSFDLIVFDCPPILPFVDAVLIGARTDGVVMVYQSGRMARRALRRAKEQLVSAQVKILGMVLNDTKAVEMGPGYAEYYNYEYYSREKDAEKGA